MTVLRTFFSRVSGKQRYTVRATSRYLVRNFVRLHVVVRVSRCTGGAQTTTGAQSRPPRPIAHPGAACENTSDRAMTLVSVQRNMDRPSLAWKPARTGHEKSGRRDAKTMPFSYARS